MRRLVPFLLLLLPLVAKADPLYFPYNPALSPDAKTIYFSYDGDIFKVPADGGVAMRFVSLGALESHPKVSPDGKWIPDSPVKEGSKAIVRNPLSAIVCAYNPDDCSLHAPKGPDTAIAGSFPDASLGTYISAASVIPK